MTTKSRLFLAWLPTALWCVVIAFESTTTFSGDHTAMWTRRLFSLFSIHLNASQVELANHLLRKTGHFFGYGVMSWFAFRGWMETLAWQRERALFRAGRPIAGERRWHLRAAILAVLVTFAVASLDEFHQTRLPGRTGVFRDVILDTMGGVLAQILLLLYWTRPKPGVDTTAQQELDHISAD
jgi:VanZ family protein